MDKKLRPKERKRYLFALLKLRCKHNGHPVWESLLAKELGYIDERREKFQAAARKLALDGQVTRQLFPLTGEVRYMICLTPKGIEYAEYLALPIYKKFYRLINENKLATAVATALISAILLQVS